jgi:hypothetical protein
MCTLKLPKGVVEAIDKFRKTCIWRESANGAKDYNLTAWELVTMPKEKGGLRVKNLHVQNEGLLIKPTNSKIGWMSSRTLTTKTRSLIS